MAYKRRLIRKYCGYFVRPIGNMWAIYAKYHGFKDRRPVIKEQLLEVGPIGGSKYYAKKRMAELQEQLQ